MVEFIDYAVTTYGKRVKFLNFREALERVNANLLAGEAVRSSNGQDNGVRLIDLNNDGFVDVLIGNEKRNGHASGIRNAETRRETGLPLAFSFPISTSTKPSLFRSIRRTPLS